MRGSLIATVILIWWIISLFFPPTFMPSPYMIFKDIFRIIYSGDFFVNMWPTFLRVLTGFSWAFVLSVVIGMLMGFFKPIEEYLELGILVGLTIPGLAWIVIALIWFGMKEFTAIFAIFIVVLPMVTVNMWEGTKALDKELIEMGLSFSAKRRMIIVDIIIPQLIPYLFAATRFGFSVAWKIVVIGEMLGLSTGIGYMINYNFERFSLSGVLAWTLCFTLVMIFLEFGVLKVIENRVTRWRPKLVI